MPTFQHGRHEHGQNFLTSPRHIKQLVGLAAEASGPIVEFGAGAGALTLPLAQLGRPVVAVEIDRRLARSLQGRVPANATVVEQDFLRYRLPAQPHTLVANVPFHLTTALLRRILRSPHWSEAHLVVQWEVARRRAGVGGRSMMTSQWEPWFTFALHGRIPAAAFTPRPSVDAGLLTISRRRPPLVGVAERAQFQALVHRVYSAPGRGIAQMVRSAGLSPRQVTRWLVTHGIDAHALPKDLGVEAWVGLHRTTGNSPPRRLERAWAD